ncbi:MAG: hypothetical protein LBI56_01765 [Puniceicoccales bacterium]|nr:hypothetical protein [Puniceicoccales bacterium]
MNNQINNSHRSNCPTTLFADPFASVNVSNSQPQGPSGQNFQPIQVRNLSDLANIFSSMSIK